MIELACRLVAEGDVTPAEENAIKRLLVAAFPQHAVVFTNASYDGARPAYRLWLETPTGAMVAHLDFERRVIGVGEADMRAAARWRRTPIGRAGASGGRW